MTDNKMPDEIWAWTNQESKRNGYIFKSWSSIDECKGTEFNSCKYHSTLKYQAVVKELDEANSLLGDMSVFLDNLLADISLGYEHVGIDWEKYAREKKQAIKALNTRADELCQSTNESCGI